MREVDGVLDPVFSVAAGLFEQGLRLTTVRARRDPKRDRGVASQYPEPEIEPSGFGHPNPILQPCRRMRVQGSAVHAVADLRSYPRRFARVAGFLGDRCHRQNVDAGRPVGEEPDHELFPRSLPPAEDQVVRPKEIGLDGPVADDGGHLADELERERVRVILLHLGFVPQVERDKRGHLLDVGGRPCAHLDVGPIVALPAW